MLYRPSVTGQPGLMARERLQFCVQSPRRLPEEGVLSPAAMPRGDEALRGERLARSASPSVEWLRPSISPIYWAISLLIVSPVAAQPSIPAGCPKMTAEGIQPNPDLRRFLETEDLVLDAGSASGAAGDVIGITFSIRNELADRKFLALSIVVCHDPNHLKVLGQPVYSDELQSLLGFSGIGFYPVNETADTSGTHIGHGFLLTGDLNRDAYALRFPSAEPLPLMTVYYRVQGNPGETSVISFCDASLALHGARCNYNAMSFVQREFPNDTYNYLPRSRTDGVVTVLDGPATHPERPPEPPEAKVYLELPSDFEANFRVRIEGRSVRPGDLAVAVPVYVSADVEFTGIMIPLQFEKEYLRLARAEQNFIGGLVVRDYAGGKLDDAVIITSGRGVANRRLAGEGEEILAGTLYFDVLEAASEVSQTAVRIGGPAKPWIGVRHQSGLIAGDAVVRSQIEPFSVTPGVLLLGETGAARRGDVNLDGVLDISDPVSLLVHLFQGAPAPACPAAADFNEDRAVDISDPIAILGHLFLGQTAGGVAQEGQVACR